jgi:hypothetical protein
MRPRKVVLCAAVVAGASLAAPGAAVDGVIEINQAKVAAGGVTSGDAPGFPVTISAGGSYRLTSNLVVAAGGQPDPQTLTGIQVIVTDGSRAVDIDLNGFAIVGPVTCTWSDPSPSCNADPEASGHGIYVTAGSLHLHDGTIQGFAGNGVQATAGPGQFRNLFIQWSYNGAVAYFAQFENVTAWENRGQGFAVAWSVLHRIVSGHNALQGIVVDQKSVLRDCSSTANAGDDIAASAGSLVLDCATDAP